MHHICTTAGVIRVNPNITGMGLLLNSTGMCVLSVTQFCVAFLLHKCVICVTQDV